MSNKLKAFGWAVLWTLTFSVAMTVNKLLAKGTSISGTVFFRSIFGLVAIAPLLIRQGFVWPKAKNWKVHLARIASISLAVFSTYSAYRILPLICATVIGFSGPLFTVVLSRIILKHEVTLSRWIALLVGYSGVIVALGVSFKASSMVGILASLSANFFAGLGIVSTKVLTKDEPSLTLMTIPTVVNSFIFFPPMVATASAISQVEMLKFLAIGFFGMGSQFCFLSALKLVRPSFLAPLEYLRFVFSSIIGILIFGETVRIRLIIGFIMIAAGALFLAKTEHLTDELRKT